MKVVLALAVLCGLILTCESVCDSTACTRSATTCSAYTTQLACYNTEKGSCQAGASITIDALIASTTIVKNVACGAGSITQASLPVMILSLVAVYFKLK